MQSKAASAINEPTTIDEAFADLPDLSMRLDAGNTEAGSVEIRESSHVAETERLVAKIGEQMKMLEQQQDRLSRLLSELNIPQAI